MGGVGYLVIHISRLRRAGASPLGGANGCASQRRRVHHLADSHAGRYGDSAARSISHAGRRESMAVRSQRRSGLF